MQYVLIDYCKLQNGGKAAEPIQAAPADPMVYGGMGTPTTSPMATPVASPAVVASTPVVVMA